MCLAMEKLIFEVAVNCVGSYYGQIGLVAVIVNPRMFDKARKISICVKFLSNLSTCTIFVSAIEGGVMPCLLEASINKSCSSLFTVLI